jgi:hypothetical protein
MREDEKIGPLLAETSTSLNDFQVWVGLIEVRQLPGLDHQIILSGNGAFTWVTCWAIDAASYKSKVSEVMTYYGLFIAEVDDVMPFTAAEEKGIVTDELLEQFTNTAKDENFCLYGTFHNYPSDN